jgi:hypothetical protein
MSSFRQIYVSDVPKLLFPCYEFTVIKETRMQFDGDLGIMSEQNNDWYKFFFTFEVCVVVSLL